MVMRALLSIVLLTLAWPALQVLLFAVRFGRLPRELVFQSPVFLLPGLLSASLLVFCVDRGRRGSQRRLTIAGYVVALPFALVASLAGGLVVAPAAGVAIFGFLPAAIGIVGGFAFGALLGRHSPATVA
jgi:hypothetical protein